MGAEFVLKVILGINDAEELRKMIKCADNGRKAVDICK